MMDNINMISINELMAELTGSKQMRDITLEYVIRKTVEFINIVGFPDIYKNKLADVEIHQNRGVLPCDILKTVQVMGPNHEALKKMTDNFDSYMESIPAYKIQGKCIFTTFSEGVVKVAYRAMYLDDNGFPMIPDMPLFIKALKLYIKQEVYGEKFEDGDISGDVYKKVEQDYCWAVSQLTSHINLPDLAEMENITNMFNQLIPSTHEYRKGFLHVGDHVDLPNKRF